MQEAKITLNDGSSYLTPVDNLDNVKRILAGKYKDIEFPGYKEEIEGENDDDNTGGPTKDELRAKYEEVFGKKPGNKSVETMMKEIDEKLNEATN